MVICVVIMCCRKWLLKWLSFVNVVNVNKCLVKGEMFSWGYLSMVSVKVVLFLINVSSVFDFFK